MASSNPRILIADDQPDVLIALRLLLKSEGFETESASSPTGILSAIENRDFDAVLMDLNYARDTTSGQEGLDLLCRIQTLDSTPSSCGGCWSVWRPRTGCCGRKAARLCSPTRPPCGPCSR